jgi:DNA-binding MarR family transcriptional regulator
VRTTGVLSLLNSVDDGAQWQRRIAEDLGIALGLVNAYLKRCIKKGLVKVRQASARRYTYYLTPRGFTEKSADRVLALALLGLKPPLTKSAEGAA